MALLHIRSAAPTAVAPARATEGPAHGGRHPFDLGHQVGELVGQEGLSAVHQGGVRSGMDVDHDPVGPGGHPRPGQRRHQFPPSPGMRRVDHHRKV